MSAFLNAPARSSRYVETTARRPISSDGTPTTRPASSTPDLTAPSKPGAVGGPEGSRSSPPPRRRSEQLRPSPWTRAVMARAWYFSVFANSPELATDPPPCGPHGDALGGLVSRGDFYSECKLRLHRGRRHPAPDPRAQRHVLSRPSRAPRLELSAAAAAASERAGVVELHIGRSRRIAVRA